MRKSVAWMANNHVAANLLMIFVLLSGFIAMMGLKRETFPEFSLDQVQVQVPYLGASPEEVEEGVTRRIEERLSGLEGVRRIRSTSAEGMAVVTVEVELGADLGKVQDDVKNEIDRIDTFPAETEKPVIKEMVRRNRVIDVVVYGEVSEKALKVAAERVRDDLRAQTLISQVEISGVRADEIAIEVSEYVLRRHGLTLEQVRQAVQRAGEMPVEGELGGVGGDEDSSGAQETAIPMTDPDQARAFVEQTGVASLAIAIGNAHGIYKGEPKLDFDRLAELRDAVPGPLVLHGASGLSDDDLRRAISLGVRKINVNTEIRQTLFGSLERSLEQGVKGYDVTRLFGAAMEAMQQTVEEKIDVFSGSPSPSS